MHRYKHKKNIFFIFELLLFLLFSGSIYSQGNKIHTKKVKSAKSSKSAVSAKKSKKKKVTPKKKHVTFVRNKKLTVYVKSKGIRLMLFISGINKTDIQYSVGFRTKTLPIADIQSANFITDYNAYKAKVLERNKEYTKAAGEIIQGLAPALKYIKLPDNNLVDPLFDAAYLYLRAASVYDDKDAPEYNKEKAQEEYAKAARVFKKITRAQWYYGAKLAKLNVIFCNIKMHKLDRALKKFKKVDEPVLGDAAFGLYWLIDAQLKFNNNQLSEALDSVVKSIVFDTKDIHTFPEALLLSGFCYEDMLDNYRARDVYFEISELFQGTPEGEIAFSSIQFMRNNKLAELAEGAGLEKVFFDTVEDVNKKIDVHIELIKEKKRLEKEALDKREQQKENKQKNKNRRKK